MVLFKRVLIRKDEVGLSFRDGEFQGLLTAGRHWVPGPTWKIRVEVVSRRAPWLRHEQLDLIVKSGALEGQADVVDLKDNERGLVWIDGRFSHVLPPGLYAYWKGFKEVRVEVVDARKPRFEHDDFRVIVRSPYSGQVLEVRTVNRYAAGVSFLDGKYVETLPPGTYAFWKGVADSKVIEVDLRDQTLDVTGQEIMTADKVTLRMNAVVVYRVIDARQGVTVSDGARQSLYRDAQLVLRAIVATRDLDAFLTDKDAVTGEFAESVAKRARELGLEIVSVGIRDVILPGDMKHLLNRVTEAKKAAEANLIARREETAAMRSQANTARLLVDNPTLMRLRELEVLEKVASSGNLNVVLGDKGLADRVVNML
ncbi:SPFH domain / Band 7 family protein [Planctomycetes bacterium Pan216]|uniref:SPFH domain / Band 7 family protein n=1 Tax=Kolteria novifilia TaxID=2527975 RepID=A0A518B416_9BACT|nr:SPFH domain / Band 7 family protein [Planctomycetes bacterium Pan216]